MFKTFLVLLVTVTNATCWTVTAAQQDFLPVGTNQPEQHEQKQQQRQQHPGVALAEAQIEWLVSRGGIYSSKISIEPLFSNDNDNDNSNDNAYVPLGMFAKDNFTEGEVIMVIPRHCLLTAGPDSEDMCQTAHNLLQERKLQEKSDYAPYVSYLFSKDRVPLPSTFSEQGKRLLEKIRGPKLPPDDLTMVSYEYHCRHQHDSSDDDGAPQKGDDEDEDLLLEFAYLTVVSRAWSDKLVPVYDMMNHNSGQYANVDSTPIHDVTQDIKVMATRDIKQGEQLCLSYMDCIDEEGFELEYVLPQMFRDFGFIDQYPQRWIFPTGRTDLVFDLDYKNSNNVDGPEPDLGKKQQMNITWRTEPPTRQQNMALNTELNRLQALKSFVQKSARELNQYEQEVALEYYNSLTVALQYATGRWKEIPVTTTATATVAEGEPTCEIGRKQEPSKESEPTQKDNTSTSNEPNNNEGIVPEDWMACEDFWRIEEDFEVLDEFYTDYQGVDVFYKQETDDMCLFMDGYLHTCASSRPHYHEVFVHYAARFIDQVKRVVFIGGGDSMVLHEVMKYPSLELVVGLELDQTVVRQAFKYFGTQPHWDDERVQWYFGDAAKSLSVLPSDYYGSFDLVIIDILSEVAEELKVNEELSIIEAAVLLMKPDGIIVKNEDEGYAPGAEPGIAKYSVDLVYHDVPWYCLQVFVAASNKVDFLAVQPTDHDVETLYLKDLDDFQDYFDSWYNFGTGEHRQRSECIKGKAAEKPGISEQSYGVLLVLETENTTIPMESAASIEQNIFQAVSKAGLSPTEFFSIQLAAEMVDGFSVSLLMEEGYIIARCLPSLRYCAFDVQLYGQAIATLDTVKAKLVDIVQSRQPSTYRFVTTGMFDKTSKGLKMIGPPSGKELCYNETVGSPDGKRIRKERKMNSFDSPRQSTLHAYNNSLPLEQWLSQKQIGSQALVHYDVPLFWVGQKVLIEDQGSWLPGTVTSIQGEGKYEVIYDEVSQPREKTVHETRLTGPADKKKFSNFLNETLKVVLDLVLEEAEETMDFGDLVQKEVSIGDGLLIIHSWSGGNVVATWDGKCSVAINLFLFYTEVEMVLVFDDLLENEALASVLDLVAFDDFPRGVGSVINFVQDTEYIKFPIWA